MFSKSIKKSHITRQESYIDVKKEYKYISRVLRGGFHYLHSIAHQIGTQPPELFHLPSVRVYDLHYKHSITIYFTNMFWGAPLSYYSVWNYTWSLRAWCVHKIVESLEQFIVPRGHCKA